MIAKSPGQDKSPGDFVLLLDFSYVRGKWVAFKNPSDCYIGEPLCYYILLISCCVC